MASVNSLINHGCLSIDRVFNNSTEEQIQFVESSWVASVRQWRVGAKPSMIGNKEFATKNERSTNHTRQCKFHFMYAIQLQGATLRKKKTRGKKSTSARTGVRTLESLDSAEFKSY